MTNDLDPGAYIKMQPPRAYTVTANIVGITCCPDCAGDDCEGCPASTPARPTDKLVPLARVLKIVEEYTCHYGDYVTHTEEELVAEKILCRLRKEFAE